MSNTLRPYGLQHTRLPCPSPTPSTCSNSFHWVSDVIQPSCRLWSPSPPAFILSASGSFPKSQLFTSDGQSIGTSASASVLTMNIQGWFPLGLTGWISLHSKGLSRVLPNTKIQKHQFSSAQPSLWSNSHIHTCLLEIYHSNLWFWKSHSENLQAHQQTHLRESLW